MKIHTLIGRSRSSHGNVTMPGRLIKRRNMGTAREFREWFFCGAPQHNRGNIAKWWNAC
jgi:hypothetical protein